MTTKDEVQPANTVKITTNRQNSQSNENPQLTTSEHEQQIQKVSYCSTSEIFADSSDETRNPLMQPPSFEDIESIQNPIAKKQSKIFSMFTTAFSNNGSSSTINSAANVNFHVPRRRQVSNSPERSTAKQSSITLNAEIISSSEDELDEDEIGFSNHSSDQGGSRWTRRRYVNSLFLRSRVINRTFLKDTTHIIYYSSKFN